MGNPNMRSHFKRAAAADNTNATLPTPFPAAPSGNTNTTAQSAHATSSQSTGQHSQRRPPHGPATNVVTRIVRHKDHFGDVTISATGVERTQLSVTTGIAPSGKKFFKRQFPFSPSEPTSYNFIREFLAMNTEEKEKFMREHWIHLNIDQNSAVSASTDDALQNAWSGLPDVFTATVERLTISIDVPEDSEAFEEAIKNFNSESPIWAYIASIFIGFESMTSLRRLDIVIRGSAEFGSIDAHAACTVPFFAWKGKVRMKMKYQKDEDKAVMLSQGAYAFMRRAYGDFTAAK